MIAFERPRLEPEPEPEPVPTEAPVPPEIASPEPGEAPVEPRPSAPNTPEQPEPERPPIDWTAVTQSTIRAHAEDARQAEHREDAMWRQSYSMMFERAETFTLEEPPPPIDGFRFEPDFRVLGIGVKIGNCFFGIPILGVPVEQRSVGPNVIVCAQRSE